MKLLASEKLKIKELERLSKEFIVRANLYDRECNKRSNDGILKLLEKKIQQIVIRKEDGDSSSSEDFEDQDSYSPKIFHKFSPLCAEKTTVPCPVCPSSTFICLLF